MTDWGLYKADELLEIFNSKRREEKKLSEYSVEQSARLAELRKEIVGLRREILQIEAVVSKRRGHQATVHVLKTG